MKKFILAPSILSCNFLELKNELDSITIDSMESNKYDLRFHLDIMDGLFVPNLSFGDSIIKQICEYTNIKIDVHLMVQQPELMVSRLISIKNIHQISFHIEACQHPHRLLQNIQQHDKTAGLALNPGTSIDCLDNSLLELADAILIMSVNPGFGGQKFIPSTIEKIKKLSKKQATRKDLLIQVDGGINEYNYLDLIDAKANYLVMGNAIFEKPILERKKFIHSIFE